MPPKIVTITGASGNLAYSILFRIAAGDMLGYQQPVILKLLDVESAESKLRAVVMELEDCAYPLLHAIIMTHEPDIAFKDADFAILIGSLPRTKGMERKDLLLVNGEIFIQQGAAIAKYAKSTIKVLVVGNPANTNALIALKHATGLKHRQITSMMRLDHNRAIAQIANKTNTLCHQITNMIVWGNHSNTQYPDVSYVKLNGVHAQLDTDYLVNEFIPTVQKRGAAVIEVRGGSSAASAASAAIDHMRDWVHGTVNQDWVTMGVLSDGSYGVPEGIFFGFPVTCSNGEYHIVQGLNIPDKKMLANSYEELLSEQNIVKNML